MMLKTFGNLLLALSVPFNITKIFNDLGLIYTFGLVNYIWLIGISLLGMGIVLVMVDKK